MLHIEMLCFNWHLIANTANVTLVSQKCRFFRKKIVKMSDVEDMDYQNSGYQPPPSPSYNNDPAEAASSTEEEALLVLSLKWLEPEIPQKSMKALEKLLQSWFNRRKVKADCSVIKSSGDGSVLVKIKPVPDSEELLKLEGETLTTKEKKSVKIESVKLQKSQTPEVAAVDVPASSATEPPPDVQMQVKEESSLSSSAAASSVKEEPDSPLPVKEAAPTLKEETQAFPVKAAASAVEEETCTLPVSHFWYVNHIYKEEMKRIEKNNGIKINAEVKVTFEASRKSGNQKRARSDFINLVQNCIGDSDGLPIKLKYIDPEGWSNMQKTIQKKDNKLLITLNSEEMIACGPRQGQDAIAKMITTTKTLNPKPVLRSNPKASVGELIWASQEKAEKIDMIIQDPLAETGLILDESLWKRMTTSFSEDLAKIKAKFGVDLIESSTRQGLVTIKPCHKGFGGSASMESHAVRVLLHLCQNCATSATLSPQQYGGTVLNGAATGGGATGGDSKDDNCPICLEPFTNKKQLKCKHEFCESCMEQSEKSLGPICPICKYVFGKMEGDQPDGQMTWTLHGSSLPGFSGCGTIEINYYIPSGKQTEKHPQPGEYYSSIGRTAYLPDNREGKEVLRLLKKAFDQRLIFTIGTSRTTGMDNQVTWNDIHHKTNTTGGPQRFGYPDPHYLTRVREELKAKGIE